MKKCLYLIGGALFVVALLSGCVTTTSDYTGAGYEWYGKSGVTPAPVEDVERGGEWWWPENPGTWTKASEWGNRGVVYVAKPAPKPVVVPVVKEVPKPVIQEKVVTKIVEKPVVQERIVEKIVEKPVIREKIVEKIVEKPVIREKIVEKLVCFSLNDIYFNYDSSKLTGLAKDMIKKNVVVLKNAPKLKVMLEGYASPEGKKEYNLKLSERRAEAVKKQLVAEGIDESRISTSARGAWEISKESWPFVRIVHFGAEM